MPPSLSHSTVYVFRESFYIRTFERIGDRVCSESVTIVTCQFKEEGFIEAQLISLKLWKKHPPQFTQPIFLEGGVVYKYLRIIKLPHAWGAKKMMQKMYGSNLGRDFPL